MQFKIKEFFHQDEVFVDGRAASVGGVEFSTKDTDASESLENIKDDFVAVNTLSKIASVIMFIFGFYIHFHGDIRPGGGFQAGVMFAGVFILIRMVNLIKRNNQILFEFNLKMVSFFGFFVYFFAGVLSIFFKKNVFSFSLIDFKLFNVLLINLIELGICLGVFSAFYRIFDIFFTSLKEENILE